MKAKILEILENKARDGWDGNQTCIGIIDFDKLADELVELLSASNNVISKELPKIQEGEILEYCCLGYPNDWFEVPSGIVDMKYFEPIKMRIRKSNGETVLINC